MASDAAAAAAAGAGEAPVQNDDGLGHLAIRLLNSSSTRYSGAPYVSMGATPHNLSKTAAVTPPDGLAATTMSGVLGPSGDGTQQSTHVLAYILVPLGSLAFIILLSFLVVFILRKSKLDRLRHHLMPLYNFDPAEDTGDWESELLEEEKEQSQALTARSPSPIYGPKLKFHADV